MNDSVLEQVVLVDENDQPIGVMEKLEAHEKGLLHRAFSILLFNSNGELLIQQRAASKYHSPMLWTNACCSHPRPDETLEDAVNRRLQEELYLSIETSKIGQFIYRAEFENGLTEYELDHVFFGTTNNMPKINDLEANDYRWISLTQLKIEVENNPDNFTFWFKEILSQYESEIKKYCDESL